MRQFLSGVNIRILSFLKGLLQSLNLLMRKLGATTTLFAGDEEVIVQATVRVTWGKGTQGLEL